MATCDHPTDTGRCKRTVREPDVRCFMHDGTGTPPGHGAPPGNQNAAGNSGGGAPNGNMNAAKYHGWSDPNLHYQRLDGDAKQWVDQRAEWYASEATADLDREEIEQKSQHLATLEHQSGLALANTLAEGMSVEREREQNGHTFTQKVVNPSQKAEFRLYRKEWALRAELGVLSRGDQ